MSAKNTVVLKKYVGIMNEYAAASAITPGHLLELASATTVQPHSNAGKNCALMVAVENVYEGQTIDDAFAAADPVQCWSLVPGEEFQGILANGENVSVGDFLESAGDGTLQKHTASSAGAIEYPKAIVGIALEAVDMSGSSGVDPTGLIRVRAI